MRSPFEQGYLDAVERLDRKGQGKPCGKGFISAQKKCSKQKAQQLAADLKAGDKGARARVRTGAKLARARQQLNREIESNIKAGKTKAYVKPKPEPNKVIGQAPDFLQGRRTLVVDAEKVGNVTPKTGDIKRWRGSPGSLDAATKAAAHYAKKDGKPMMVVPGNSFMNKTFNIYDIDEDGLGRSQPGILSPVNMRIVQPNGDVYSARGSKLRKARQGDELSRIKEARKASSAGEGELTSKTVNIAQPEERLAFALQELNRAKASGNQENIAAWDKEYRAAQKNAIAVEQQRQRTQQQDIFGLLGQTEQEYDVTLPLFSQKRDSAFLAGYYGCPLGTSSAYIAGYLNTYRRDSDGKAQRDRVVTRAIETGFRSGIDTLVRYGLDQGGRKIVGYFMADGDTYYFQIAGDTVSYKGIQLKQDSALRRDRGPIPPKPGAKKKRNCKIGLECGQSCINQKKTCRIKLEQNLQNEVERLRAQLAEMEGKLAQAQTRKPAQPGDVRDEALSDLNFDPKRFQYKLLPGETGATGSLTGVRKWDPNLAGVVQVWKDPADGKTYIVNGHNRATLANKLGVEEITVRYLKAKDAAEARAIGAITNIAEGRGNPLDAAKFFRDTGLTRQDLENKGIPMQERIAKDGLAIAALEDTLFRRVVDGRLPMQRAAVIGASGLDHPQQKALVEMIEKREKRGKVTNDTIRELADIVKSSETQTEFTLDLFGGSESQKSLAIDKAELQSSIRQRLSREKRLFSTVGRSRSAQELERGGNKINVEQSANIAEETQQALRTFDKMKNVAGGLSDEINAATRQIAEGADKRKVQRELYNNILKRIQSGDY